MSEYGFAEGTPGVRHEDVAHLLVPGRERSPDGMDLSEHSIGRVDTAGAFYYDHMESEEGLIVCSGYKTPSDHNGRTWMSPRGVHYQGRPEGYSMRVRLIGRHGIPSSRIRVEPDSIDTVRTLYAVRRIFPMKTRSVSWLKKSTWKGYWKSSLPRCAGRSWEW